MESKIDFTAIERKWQKRWEEKGIFNVSSASHKKKFYVLEMFPYPSGSGLHMGHAFNYTIGDIYTRYKRMQGFNVLYPMGYDAFGLPAENAAIKAHSHPKTFTEKSIETFLRQQKELGLSYDWSRMVKTCSPEYYKWNQYLFIKLMEKGLVYRKNSSVNWCPKCNTVLANEQVHNGTCWRHEDTEVEQKSLEQWFIKTTTYADELVADLEKLDWPKRIKIMQENWIGKSYGTLLHFKIVDENSKETGKSISTFTTRPDTVYGITYLVFAAEHPMVSELIAGTKQEKEIKRFIEEVKRTSIIERTAEGKPKNGMFLGKYFINPFNNEKCPLWVADYALADYGTGAVMAVPAHDQRDFEFAKKYKLPIRIVISPENYRLNPEKMARAYLDEGVLVNSGEFNGTNSQDAIEDISKYAEKKRWGEKTVSFKLKDWLVSRQRYWGTPIPVVYCKTCGIVPEKLEHLPVLLPEDVSFTSGGNPLQTSKTFMECTCPKCGGEGRRETDTMDTFFDSAWYFLRYCDAQNVKEPFDSKKAAHWMPVDLYIGGAEHACMHLIYARFFTKALRDMGMLKVDEPFSKLFNQGMLHKDGVVMSKSKGNVVLPEEISKTHGIDTARLFLVSIASPDKDLEWSDEGINGSLRFVKRVHGFMAAFKEGKMSKLHESRFNRLLKEYSDDIENIRYNMAVIKLKEMFSCIEEGCSSKHAAIFVKAMAPILPHLAEEYWEMLGHKGLVSVEAWPEADEKKIDLQAEAAEEMVHAAVKDIQGIIALTRIEKVSRITLIVAEEWKYSFMKKIKQEVEKTHNVGEIMKAVMDPKHGKEIAALVPRLVKDRSKIPEIVVEQYDELEVLKRHKDLFRKEFGCDIEVVKAEESKEQKAKQALPGKPAIVLS